jgi:cyanophycinase
MSEQGAEEGPALQEADGRPGPVMVIGGAEDKLRDRVILTRFVNLADRPGAHIVVISTASSLGDEATEFYRHLFENLGVTRITGLRPLTRDEADDPSVAATLEDATGVFLTGGNQLRLSLVVGGTRLGRAVVDAHQRGPT